MQPSLFRHFPGLKKTTNYYIPTESDASHQPVVQCYRYTSITWWLWE